MTRTAQELNNSEWRNDGELSGTELAHVCRLVFHIEENGAR